MSRMDISVQIHYKFNRMEVKVKRKRLYFNMTIDQSGKKSLICERTFAQPRSFCTRAASEGRFYETHLWLKQSDAISNTQHGDFRIFCANAFYRDFAFRCFITAAHLYTDVMCSYVPTYAILVRSFMVSDVR